jgi:CHASE3 domain sensor protein
MRVLAGFIVALSLLLAGSTYTYRATVGAAAATEWVEHTQEVRAALASLYGSLAESYHLGVNSYLVNPVEFSAFVDLVAQLGMYSAVMNRLPA